MNLWAWITSWFSSGTPSSKIAAIQAMVVKLCSFLPMAETVVAVMGTAGLAAAPVFVIARQICAVVTASPVSSVAPPLTLLETAPPAPVVVVGSLNGVPIQGVFVK